MQIELKNLTKQFGETLAVDDLTLTLKSGKLTSLLGPSGCGKSTILNMISGIIPVTHGQILFDGREVTGLPAHKRNIGLVFQNYALYPHMTVLENICFPLEIKKVPKKERLQRATRVAELVRIDEMLDRKPGTLSGGQQQRVAIARALVKEPQVLLLDEPLSNLDAKLRVEMREEIRRIQRASEVTTVFVTHDQEEASSISDEIVILKKGTLQQKGTPRELYDEPHNYFVADFLGAPEINKIHGTMQGGRFVPDNSDVALALPLVKDVADGRPVILAIRAESIVYPTEQPIWEVEVIERYSINKDELSVLDLAGQRFRAFISADHPIRVGETIGIGLKDRGVFLFDAATGERLS